jgi:hypothetical protein
MLLLYIQSGSGALDIGLVEKMPTAQWDAIERNAIRYMGRNRVAPEGIEIVKQTPFELWRGTNSFGDDFELLYFRAAVETYVELERRSDTADYRSTVGYSAIAETLALLGHPIRFIAVEMSLEETVGVVQTPVLITTSDVVEAALRDAETLIGTRGAASGLDRVHTAFHGYLESVCRANGIPFKEDAGITALFALLRDRLPALHLADVDAQRMIDQVLRGMARIVDALDPIRNQKSLAHPNPTLLEDPEAMLAINCIRTMLHYLNART